MPVKLKILIILVECQWQKTSWLSAFPVPCTVLSRNAGGWQKERCSRNIQGMVGIFILHVLAGIITFSIKIKYYILR